MIGRRSPMGLSACVVAALAALAPLVQAGGSVRQTSDVRALWVTRHSLGSPQAVADLVRAARGAGFNTLLVQVRGRGDAYYSSGLEPRAVELAAQPAFDPLGDAVARGHEAGMQVHAWVVANLVSSAAELPAAREHLVYRQPDWLMVPRALAAEMLAVDSRSPEYLGRLSRWTRANSDQVEGLYVSPAHPGAATHLAAVVSEIVERYDVDGVHLDYIRYPSDAFDYSRGALEQFKAWLQPLMTAEERAHADAREALDPLAYPNLYPGRWGAFRRSRLTAMVMRVRTAVRAARPDALLSVAVVPEMRVAESAKFQDWRTWLDQSLVDIVCPMAYTTDAAEFRAQIAEAQGFAAGRPVWAGVGAYRLTPDQTVAHIDAARRLGVPGVILFSYDALVSPPNSASTLAELGRAAFGGSN
ncbi:MAG: family 10 glycosylhydrolase [Acidobacteriota bacterium]